MPSDIAIEQNKYERIYAMNLWREEHEPQIEHLKYFRQYCLRGKETVTDFGCGSGEAALMLKALGHEVNLVDIAHNCLRRSVDLVLGDRLLCCPIHEMPPSLPVSEWGYCTDVMEHIPEDLVFESLRAIREKAKHCYFSICGRPDGDGQKIGEVLHVTVRPIAWWLEQIIRHWEEVIYAPVSNEAENYVVIARSII